jgi:hypothetical protein
MSKPATRLRIDYLLVLGLAGIAAAWGEAAQQEGAVAKQATGADTHLTEKAVRKIQDKLKGQGVTEDQVRALCRTARPQYSSGGLNTVPDIDKFTEFVVTHYGFLSVRSDPIGAHISVDGRGWEGETNQESGTEVGWKTVKLTMPGYSEETGTVQVRAGQVADFYRKLKKKE